MTLSYSSTNLMTSPPTPQPKQWKTPLSPLTWNDGVFSPWNGHSPFHARAAPPQRHAFLDDLHDVRLRLQVVDEAMAGKSGIHVILQAPPR